MPWHLTDLLLISIPVNILVTGIWYFLGAQAGFIVASLMLERRIWFWTIKLWLLTLSPMLIVLALCLYLFVLYELGMWSMSA